MKFLIYTALVTTNPQMDNDWSMASFIILCNDELSYHGATPGEIKNRESSNYTIQLD